MTNTHTNTEKKKLKPNIASKNSKQINIRYQLKISFFTHLLQCIIFSPIIAVRWYFTLMKTRFFKFLLLNFSALVVILIYLFICYISLPNISKLYNYKPSLSSKFYDRNNNLIFELGNERRTYIPIEQIPKPLIYAFIATEDKTFYTNSGIDFYGLTRTAIIDVYKFVRRQKLAGASTITQQVVKNILLTNERTITRKIKEIILSYRISKILSKDKIMEIYLNHIYLGMQAYGIVSASEEYFGKTVAQLTIPEMAMLAAMPKAPSAINPFRNYNRALQRRNWVLLRMMEDGYITPDKYEEYKNTELIVKKRHNFYAPFYAPAFFTQNLLTAKETHITKNDLLNNGYKIKLTIDKDLQKLAQNALNNSLENYSKKHGFEGAIFSFSEQEIKQYTPLELLRKIDEPENINRFQTAVVLEVNEDAVKIGLKNNQTGTILLNDMLWAKQKITETEIKDTEIKRCSDVLKVGDVIIVDKKTDESNYYTLEQLPKINGGVLAMNPHTGEILAMVGGYADPAGGFNRTIQAYRQMGSVIKPFIYATALENGFTPASIFMDADISINIGDRVVWNPTNHTKTTTGPTTLRIGLEKSKNTITVRVADAVGIKKIRKTIIKSGLNPNPESNLSTALGSVESSLIDIARAYSAFVNNGIKPNTYLIDNISLQNSSNEPKDSLVFNKIYFSDCDANAMCKVDFEKNTIQEQQENTNEAQNNEDVEQNKEQKQQEDKAKNTAIFSPETSYQIINMLEGAVIRGTSQRLKSLGIPLASKTGTSNEGKDMWNVAITPELIIVVYVGYDVPMATGNYGSQYALPVVKEILSNLIGQIQFNDFPTPDGIKFIKINRKTGKKVNSNEVEIDDKNTDNTKNQTDSTDFIFEAFKENDLVNEENLQNEQASEDFIDITDINN